MISLVLYSQAPIDAIEFINNLWETCSILLFSFLPDADFCNKVHRSIALTYIKHGEKKRFQQRSGMEWQKLCWV